MGPVKGLTHVKVDDISSSSIICQHSHSIVEGHQVSQEQLAFCEAMLTVSNLLLPSICFNSFLEADLLEIPRVLLFTLFKNRCDVSLFFSHWDSA